MRKLLALVLALVMTLGLATVGTNAATTFKDDELVSASDYSEAIQVLNGMKVFVGDENGNFNPTQKITRASVAAIIYRIATGDVENKKVDNYVNLATQAFSDINEAKWAAGYIGYCYNAGYIKGYNGKFMPNDQVTGYDTIAMILRAVGYDKNHEFEGDGYTVRVAAQATKLGMLANVAAEDLKLAANREAVAQILFDAIRVPQVTWTPALEYNQYNAINANVNDKTNLNPSLGWENFKLAYNEDALSDEWGRPSYVWFGDTNATAATEFTAAGAYRAAYTAKDKVYYTDVRTPDAAYNTLAKGCDIIDDLGKKAAVKILDSERYINGVQTGATGTATAATVADTTANFGDTGVGRIVEFYKLDSGNVREVVIDTYLAKVTNTVAEQKDANDHVTRDDYNTLSVYMTRGAQTATTQYIAGNEYAKGDWLLVNVNLDTDNDESLKLTTGAAATDVRLVEVVQKADSTEAAQTKIFYNQDKHEIGGKEYQDAYQFNLDPAGTALTYKMQWFFDQFGNVIGDAELSRDDYAVLEGIRYIAGTTEYAEAVLRYFDGTTKTVTVRHMDGFGRVANMDATQDNVAANQTWLGQVDDANFRLAEVTTNVVGTDTIGYTGGTANGTGWNTRGWVSISSSTNLNAARGFAGLALYRVWTYDDGSVDLEAFEQGTGNNNATVAGQAGITSNVANPNTFTNNALVINTNVVNGSDDTLDIKFAAGALVDPTASAIISNNGATVIETHIGANTKFIYRSGTGTPADPFVYTTYTGTANLPAMTRDYTAEVFFDGTRSNVSSYVYVRSYTPNVQNNDRHVFILNNNSRYMTNAGTGIYVIDAVVDGVTTTVAGTQAQIAYLANNVGKMYHITFQGGVAYNLIPTATTTANLRAGLVNEATDAYVENAGGANVNGGLNHAVRTANGGTGACDYLALDDLTANHLTVATYAGDTTLVVDRRTTANVSPFSYNITNAKFHGDVASLDEFNTLIDANNGLQAKGIWIVFNSDVANSPMQIATDVYVGTKLSQVTTMTAAAAAGSSAIAYGSATNTGHNDNNTVTVTMTPGATVANMTYTPTVTNASIAVAKVDAGNNGNAVNVLTADDTDATGAAIAATTDAENVERVVVTAEDGYHVTTYTVTANFNNVITSVMVSEDGSNGTEAYGTAGARITDDMIVDATGTTDAAKAADIAAALAANLNPLVPRTDNNKISVSVTVAPGAKIKVVSATDIPAAITALKNTTAATATAANSTMKATADMNTFDNGGIIVAEITTPAGGVKYLAFTLGDAGLADAMANALARLDEVQAMIDTLAEVETPTAAQTAALAAAQEAMDAAKAALGTATNAAAVDAAMADFENALDATPEGGTETVEETLEAAKNEAATEFTLTWNDAENDEYTVTAVDAEANEIANGDKVDKDTEVTVTITPAAGYKITSVTGGDADVTEESTDPVEVTVTMNADKELVIAAEEIPALTLTLKGTIKGAEIYVDDELLDGQSKQGNMVYNIPTDADVTLYLDGLNLTTESYAVVKNSQANAAEAEIIAAVDSSNDDLITFTMTEDVTLNGAAAVVQLLQLHAADSTLITAMKPLTDAGADAKTYDPEDDSSVWFEKGAVKKFNVTTSALGVYATTSATLTGANVAVADADTVAKTGNDFVATLDSAATADVYLYAMGKVANAATGSGAVTSISNGTDNLTITQNTFKWVKVGTELTVAADTASHAIAVQGTVTAANKSSATDITETANKVTVAADTDITVLSAVKVTIVGDSTWTITGQAGSLAMTSAADTFVSVDSKISPTAEVDGTIQKTISLADADAVVSETAYDAANAVGTTDLVLGVGTCVVSATNITVSTAAGGSGDATNPAISTTDNTSFVVEGTTLYATTDQSGHKVTATYATGSNVSTDQTLQFVVGKLKITLSEA